MTFKATKLALHINTGDKKDNGNNKQLHVVLFNNEANPNTFHGGVAEVVEGEYKGKKRKELKAVTAPVEINGKTYQNAAQPLVAFVNRAKTGRVMSIAIMRDKKQVGEIKFKKDFGGKNGEVLSGTYNATGLQFDDQYRVVSGTKGNFGLTAEVVGGLKDEILAAMITPAKKAAKAETPAA